jgi:uncharacterized membrane protein
MRPSMVTLTAMGFSAGAAIRFGWETFKRRPWFFIGSTLIIMLVSGLVEAFTRGVDTAVTGSAEEPSLLGSLISLAAGTLINMGATAFYLAAHDNPDGVDLSALWHPRPFLKFLAASILIMLAVVAGLILLIVPGIIFALMFMFTTFIVIEREFGPIDAMKESRRITHGHKWQLLGFSLLLVLINLLGVAALVVGLLVSIPVSSLAFVHAYRFLGGKAEPLPVDATLRA